MSERGVSGIVGDDEWNTVRIGSGFVLQWFGARYLFDSLQRAGDDVSRVIPFPQVLSRLPTADPKVLVLGAEPPDPQELAEGHVVFTVTRVCG